MTFISSPNLDYFLSYYYTIFGIGRLDFLRIYVIIIELSLCDALDSIQGNIVDFMANRVIIVLTKKLRSMAPRRSQ